MFRIMLATSDHYYVQEKSRRGWRRRGGYHVSKRDAEQLIKDIRQSTDVPLPGYECQRGTVLEYIYT